MTEEIKVKMKEYGVKAVPTTVIDGNIFYQVLPPTTGKTCNVWVKCRRFSSC
jgi:hypothetical protein